MNNNPNNIISWLLEGDVSIKYQTYRDLLDKDDPRLQNRISKEGWGARFLACRNPQGHWGRDFYQPKWISTHYTILDLKNLNISRKNKTISDSIRLILATRKEKDGGINPAKTISVSDVCINGMFINYASYFGTKEAELESIVDFILSQKMSDGGFNCLSNRKGARHSSLHTTLSVLEGIHEYESNGYRYRLNELLKARQASIDFILRHQLFRSHRTGEIINDKFLSFHYPARWYYDILKAMDYFQLAEVDYDERMKDAAKIILEKRTKEGWWKLGPRYPGLTHFDMETPGKASRWNTLRALRVLRHYKIPH